MTPRRTPPNNPLQRMVLRATAERLSVMHNIKRYEYEMFDGSYSFEC